MSKAPNQGAHRLAWWLSEGDDVRVRVLEHAVSAAAIDRLLTGELLPADDVAAAIAMATGGAVQPEDWGQAVEAAWTDAPALRAAA